jgi:hypothetical protein
MRAQVTGLMLAFGVIGMGDSPSVYVPGQVRDGLYIRPHFVSTPKPGRWPGRAGEPKAPLLVPAPPPRNPLGEES